MTSTTGDVPNDATPQHPAAITRRSEIFLTTDQSGVIDRERAETAVRALDVAAPTVDIRITGRLRLIFFDALIDFGAALHAAETINIIVSGDKDAFKQVNEAIQFSIAQHRKFLDHLAEHAAYQRRRKEFNEQDTRLDGFKGYLWSTPYSMVLGKLYEVTGQAPRGSATNKSVRCPAHEDTQASLSVGIGREGKVILNCFAHCDTADILAALGLSFADLAPEQQNRNNHDPGDWIPCKDKGHVKVAEYRYTDEHGNVLYGVTRCSSKCFAQWRPEPSKKYGRRWSLRDDDGNKIRLVPYRLPEVIAAVREERVVMICEGEKDVEALRARPLITATTNQGGAGMGWPEEFAQYFHGADITIVADRDEQGRRHAESIVANLMPVARSIYVVQALYGKDASDHFAGGGNTGNFIQAWTPKPFAPETLG